jgi:hypothetical protein
LIASALLLAACGTGTVIGSALAKIFPTGKQTATIHVDFVSAGHARPSFSGTIAGQALTGTYSPGNVTLAEKLCPGTPGPDATIFTYSGQYNGTAYSFSGCLAYPSHYVPVPCAGRVVCLPGFKFLIRGSIGDDAISGSCTAFASYKKISETVERINFPFSGTVGHESVTGTAYVDASLSAANPGPTTLMATLTVG